MASVETPTEFRAEAKYVRAGPRKAQLVVSEIRGLPVAEARTALAFMTRDVAIDVGKVLASAVANAETHPDYNGEDLYVSAAYVGSGPTLKRWRARARGRVGRIKKRTCHITIRLATVEPVEAPTKTKTRRAKAEPEAPQKPQRRAKPKTPAAAEVKAVETAVEEQPKPKRSRAKKSEGTETSAETVEKPKRPPRKKPAAPAPAEVSDETPETAPSDAGTESEHDGPATENPTAEKED